MCVTEMGWMEGMVGWQVGSGRLVWLAVMRCRKGVGSELCCFEWFGFNLLDNRHRYVCEQVGM